jgi:replicative DNA helicase
VFHFDIGDMMLYEEQQHVMDNYVQSPQELYILAGTPGSAKTFFVNNIARYFQHHHKIVILSATTGVIARRLSMLNTIIHTFQEIFVNDVWEAKFKDATIW